MTTRFDSERFLDLVRTQGLSLGEPLSVRAVTDSTNDDALAAARSGAPAGAVFVADLQRRGRGRRGSEWHSTADASLAFSVLLRPNLAAERAGGLSLVAGLAVRQVVATLLERAGRSARASVKWPNDVLVNGKKLAGILVESQVQAGRLAAAVIGIGLNLGRVTLPDDVQAKATSLAEEGVSGTYREDAVAFVLSELSNRLVGLSGDPQEMLPKTLVSEFRRHDALHGLPVSVEGRRGHAVGIDDAGNLLIEAEQGRSYPVAAGHVQILSDSRSDECENRAPKGGEVTCRLSRDEA